MSDDDPGILGNLPRSRPGRRSERRPPAAAAADDAPSAAAPDRASPSEPAAAQGDLATGVVRAAEDVAVTGLRIASRLASGAIRRLPGR